MKLKAHHLLYLLWLISLGSVICLYIKPIEKAYSINHTDFKQQVFIVWILFISVTLLVLIKVLKYYGIFFIALIFSIQSCSYKIKGKLSKPTIVYSIDSLENPDEHLYNDWE